MKIREASFGNEVLSISEMIYQKTQGKSDQHTCRSRADQMVKRSVQWSRGMKKTFSVALVAESDGIVGFLYAEERHAFDLCERILFVEVLFLVGSKISAVPLLRELRLRTKKRILIQSWALLGKMESLSRLIRPLGAQKVGEIFQV